MTPRKTSHNMVFAIWRLTKVQSAFVLQTAAVSADEILSALVLNLGCKSLLNCGYRLTNKSAGTSQIPVRYA